jgi:hypothetical protein
LTRALRQGRVTLENEFCKAPTDTWRTGGFAPLGESQGERLFDPRDFDELDIRVILVEVNDGEAEAKVKEVMARRPEYKLHSKVTSIDLLYVKT